MTRMIELWIDDGTERGYSLGKFAVPEAERVTSPAEPDAEKSPVMSGGAEPAGAAKHHE